MAEKYRAKEDLYISWVKAHNAGAIVDGEKVKQYGWTDKVEKVGKADKGEAGK